jgi:UDP-N-acetylmuramoylalanine--D-glutamate ligase
MPTSTVIGLGRSGIAAAKLLRQQGYVVTLSDRGQNELLVAQSQQITDPGITVKLGDNFLPTAELDLIVVSPGVPWDVPALVAARALGIETIGEVELAWRSLKSQPWLGITGTNGKTTTTALVAAIFQAAKFNTLACGNIGYAACELALLAKNPDWVIAELSSYQIESSSTLAPKIGIFTTLTPDHLARHTTVENYYHIKSQLLQNSEFQIINGDDPYLASHAADWPRACWTSIHGSAQLLGDKSQGTYIADGWVICQGEQILPIADLKMPGSHNRQNLLMAVAAARLAGIDKSTIAKAVSSFAGVAHRLEYICSWQGVNYINDSKATNYDAADVGLTAVDAPVILIAGGEPKEGDDASWLANIQKKAAAVLLIGEAALQFAQRLQAVGFDRYEIVETMASAVSRSAILAAQYQARVVLLSPACASFDQYRSFEERGDNFRQLCLSQSNSSN